ncbi:helix-turn-helix domain-containing protein [Paenibacillus segetis]|nr:helix-turn-helix domain-containing protein [Paenibacillus segetis]
METKNITAVEKLAILLEIKEGIIGLNAKARKFGISKASIQVWRQRYKVYSFEGLKPKM